MKGEVYEVDEAMLANLDILEGYPKHYIRRKEPIQVTDGRVLECWVYLLADFKAGMLDLPFLTDYASLGTHGKPYVERYTRASDDFHNYYVDVKAS